MFLTFNKTTGQPLQVVQADPAEAVNYETEAVGAIPLPDGWPDGLSTSFVTTEGSITPIPLAPIEGTWLWDWETHTWKEVVQPASDTTTSEVKA